MKDARWAQNPSDVEAVGAIIDPTSSKQNNGWVEGEKPAMEIFNWWMNHVGNWIAFTNATVGKLFSTNFVLRNGNPVAGFVTTTRVAANDWTIDANAANIWSEGSAYEVDALVGASVDPTHGGTATFNTYYTVVATPTGIVVREGVEGAPTPVEPTLLDGDVELAQLLLGPGAITHTPEDLRQRGSFVGGRVAAETLFRVGKLVSGWAIEATTEYLTIVLTGDASVDADEVTITANTLTLNVPDVERWHTLSGVEFRDIDSGGNFVLFDAAIKYQGVSGGTAVAGLQLPNGCTVDKVAVAGWGLSASSRVRCELVRVPRTAASEGASVAVAGFAEVLAIGTVNYDEDNAITPHVVDNDANAYLMRLIYIDGATVTMAASVRYSMPLGA